MQKCGCYATAYSLETFGSTTPCVTYEQFTSDMNLFRSFFQSEVISNCSYECPLRCDNLFFYTSISFSSFPMPNYYYIMMSNNAKLAAMFNTTSETVRSALVNNTFSLLPPLDYVTTTLNKRTASLNVYYEELIYTNVYEDHKMELVVNLR